MGSRSDPPIPTPPPTNTHQHPHTHTYLGPAGRLGGVAGGDGPVQLAGHEGEGDGEKDGNAAEEDAPERRGVLVIFWGG